MRILFTFNDILGLGIMGIFIIVAIICFIIALIDVFTKNWRYKHFKCPKCGHMKSNGACGHWRNDKCDCGYEFDRDVHAARNVKLFGSTKRAECLEQASVETLTSVALDLSKTIS